MESIVVWIFSMVALASLGNAKVCPGGKHECPRTIFSETTCCQVPDGSFGCCPLPDAVCCDDHIHCCSHGSVCNGGSCEKPQHDVLDTFNQSALRQNGKVLCPDKEHSCLDDSTCCQIGESSKYGCCPMPNAVCCLDGIHCCPHDSVCDLVHRRCVGQEEENEIVKPERIPLSGFAMEAERFFDIICPGGGYECPDGDTCCQLPGGQWGCCPFVNATCCPDHLHCCPMGMKCDTTSQSCHQGRRNFTWYENKPASVALKSNYVICPGGTERCPDNTTCCQSSGGLWGCCPYLDAVCCSDHKHCCPSGYQCDITSQQCVKGAQSIFWLKKFPSKPAF